VPVEN
jgi:hypothetical protein